VDTTAPTVSNTSPADQAQDVAGNTNVTATFSEDMDSSTINSQSFTLSKSGSPMSGQVAYDANSMTATLNPDADLEAGTTYDVKTTTSAKDLAGNTIAQEKT
jgi:hypothetical protein